MIQQVQGYNRIENKNITVGNTPSPPLVSIVTPVYNGGKYLAECIESVLKQTYTNWEYIILDNCSTDNTLQIAKKYAAKDKRIKVLTNNEFLKQIPNWNESLRKISPDSKYCKVVHADDCIFPECLEKMVARAEKYPSAGIISSYRFLGSKVYGLDGEGLPHSTTFLPGRKASRMVLKTPIYLFGSPTTVLYRSDLIREREEFYDTSLIHADVDICYDLLQESDFAFVHQLLTYSRLHDESTTTFCDHYNTYILNELHSIKKYGEYYLTSKEQEELLSETLTSHHFWLVKTMLNKFDKEVWEYHKKELKKKHIELDPYKLLKAFFLEMIKIKPAAKWLWNKIHFTVKDGNEVKDKTIKDKKHGTAISKDLVT